MKKKAEILMLLLSVSLNIVCIYILYIPVNFIELQELFKKFKYCIKNVKKENAGCHCQRSERKLGSLMHIIPKLALKYA